MLNVEEARELTARLRAAAENLWELICTAYRGRIWVSLGYASWDEYCDQELGDLKLRLPREQRREVMQTLREAGLSLRAIAAATGYDKRTVSRDLSKSKYDLTKVIVAGTNGSRYRHKKALPDSFWQVTYDLAKMSDRITKLADKDEFGDYRERIKEISLCDLHRARRALDAVIAKLEGVMV